MALLGVFLNTIVSTLFPFIEFAYHLAKTPIGATD
jgi:hypothetical protein